MAKKSSFASLPTIKREEFIKELMMHGWSDIIAYGAAANVSQESAFKPAIVNPREQAYGLGQWRGSRLAHFRKQFGKDLKDATWQEQVAFINWELKNTEKRAAAELKKAKSAFEAGAAFSRYYERPLAVEKEAANRGAVAQEWFNSDLAGKTQPKASAAPKQPEKAPEGVNSGPSGPSGVGLTDKEAIRTLQSRLNKLGSLPALKEDGIAGVATRTALIAYQSTAGLVPDGVYGKKSTAKMDADLKTLEAGKDVIPPVSIVRKEKRVRIILVRGKLGDRPFGFSLGMDTLAEKLNKIPEVTATVENYGLFYSMSDDIAIALDAAAKAGYLTGCIGHSMGGDTVLKVAWYLKGFGKRLNLAVPVDPTPFGCPTIPDNVDTAIGYRNTLLLQLGGHQIQPDPSFKGKLERYDLAMSHVATDDFTGVHDRVIKAVKEMQK